MKEGNFMACKGATKKRAVIVTASTNSSASTEANKKIKILFGVDSEIQTDDLLQNNITEFEWAARNKIYPNFWGRNLTGENCLTKEEIEFIHQKGCKIAAIYNHSGEKRTEEQGISLVKEIVSKALELDIPAYTAIFLEIDDGVIATRDFMRGFASALLFEGFTPGFKANTDAAFDFDREYSRGMQTDRDIFEKCLIWAVAPSLEEYDHVTTTHLIHPDCWKPFAPSGITRDDIAIWQYGKDCHPINDDAGNETTFNVNLVKNTEIVIDYMF
jgi:hypothetical protein